MQDTPMLLVNFKKPKYSVILEKSVTETSDGTMADI